jgi:hypothetical protein
MANTTSGTYTFEKTFSIEEIIEEAYERIGFKQYLATNSKVLDARLIFYFKNGETEVSIIGK